MTTGAAYDVGYFRRVYPSGRAGQSFLDRARDATIRRTIRRHLPPTPARPSLLDTGCGYGWFLDGLTDTFDVYGVDVSDHAVGTARDRLTVPIARANIEDGIPFDRSFDVVTAINLLEHLDDRPAAVAAIRRALAPDGLAVIHLPTIDNAIGRLIYRRTYGCDHTHVYRPSASELDRLFVAHGFQKVDDSRCPHRPRWFWRALPIHPAYLAVYAKR